MRSVRGLVAVMSVVVLVAMASPASAQLNTQHVKGAVGLKGGSVPPPHLYLVAPLVYTYNTDTVRGRDGNKIPVNADVRFRCTVRA